VGWLRRGEKGERGVCVALLGMEILSPLVSPLAGRCEYTQAYLYAWSPE
jgi:hypothetical protein